MDVGTAIRNARLAKGMTQEELGQIIGVQKSAIAKWENGRVSNIKRSNLKGLADALNLNPVMLLGDIEEDPVGTANKIADMYEGMDHEMMVMISEYKTLDEPKKAQVREYVHLLAAKR